MQGRLSPPVNGRIQIFPVETWREEFAKAAASGLYCIEWIYDAETESSNPVRTDEGLNEMRRLIDSTGVRVVSICADYYMTEKLVDEAGAPCAANVAHLKWLIGRAAALQVRYIVLPFVDSSALRTQAAKDGLVSILKNVSPLAGKAGTELHVESDLPAPELVDLLTRIGSPVVRANYDIGNSASLGSVHVKDRVLGGSTVPLGTGAANFPVCFDLILRSGFAGPMILQVARGVPGNEIESAIGHRKFVEHYLGTFQPGT
jgi:L-ribulose-5-phosphate 3-epimerase